jgi:hypothetical protein
MSTLTQLADRNAAMALHEQLVRASPGRTVTPASAAALAKTIGADPARLRAAWEILGAWALRELDRMVLVEGRVRDRHDRPKAERPAGQILDPKQPLSWYQRLPLWKRPVAIGNTGRRKNLGDLTHGDCQTIAQFYGRSATTMREKADRWAAISRTLSGPETLGNAQRKLAEATIEFLRDETGGEFGSD